MPDKTPAQKMHIRPGSSIAFLHTPADLPEKLALPEGSRTVADVAKADVILEFAATQAEIEERLPAVRAVMAPETALWVVYPKGSKAAGLDISRDTIWPLAESLGMRPVGMVSIDEVWSGFRLKRGE